MVNCLPAGLGFESPRGSFFIHLFIYSTTDLDFRATQFKLDTESVLERKVGQQGPNTITFLFRTDYTHMDS